ncbi:MAG: Pr6Pr family membrane protein [Patescibacteria group bacterium]
MTHGVDIVDFLSHISNLVSILTAGIFLYLGITDSKKLDSLRALSAVYVVSVGIAFSVLIENSGVIIEYPWVSFVQHKLVPVAVVLEWIMNPPSKKFEIKDTFLWLIFPSAYFLYTQIYGYFANWYPYTFIDPRISGYFSVFIYFLGVVIGGWIISIITIFIGNKLKRT